MRLVVLITPRVPAAVWRATVGFTPSNTTLSDIDGLGVVMNPS